MPEKSIIKKENSVLSFERGDLDDVLNLEEYKPEDLLNLLETDFKEAYDSSAGVSEGYSIKEHTLMTMNQFEKYYGNKQLPGGADKGFFRFLLSMHDIGKAEAVKIHSIHRQHEFTLKKVEPIIGELGFKEKEKQLFEALVGGDNLGAYVKGEVNLNNTFFEIVKAKQKTELSLTDYLELLETYYKVDAGSYTKDSGGKESLDRLFEFDHEKNNLNFSEEVENKFVALREKVSSFEKQKEENQENIEGNGLHQKILAELGQVNIRPENRNEKNELLAPNGEKSNLSEEEWKMVRTSAFKKWFGDFEEKFNKDDLEAWTKHQYKKSLELEVIPDINAQINREKEQLSYYIKEKDEKYIKIYNEYIKQSQERKIRIQYRIAKMQAELVNENFSPLTSDYGKLLDENGEPLLMWRATNYGPNDKGNFEIPLVGKQEHHGGVKVGTFLGKKSEAWHHNEGRIKEGNNSFLYKCFANPKNIDILSQKFFWWSEKERVEKIQAKYDGIIVKHNQGGLFQEGKMNLIDLIVFDPKNILILGVE